jgi:hypothetical protein
MQKIPVGETISAAYSFAFAGFLSVLGTLWLPYVVLAAFSAGVVLLLAPDLPGHLMRGELDDSVMFGIGRVAGLIGLASIVVSAMVTVGLQERALGRVEGPTFFYFSLGAPVWRMIGAILLLILVLILILGLLVGATVAVSIAAIHFVPHVGTAIAVIAGIVAACWYIYAVVRLSFFLPAVVVAEGQIGLGRSWELGAGNFWRIFAVMFVVFVPVAIGFGIVQNAVIGPFMPVDFHAPHFHSGMSPDEIRDAYVAFAKSMLMQFRNAWPFLIVLGIIREVVNRGLGNGAIGKAYRFVTEGGGM